MKTMANIVEENVFDILDVEVQREGCGARSHEGSSSQA